VKFPGPTRHFRTNAAGNLTLDQRFKCPLASLCSIKAFAPPFGKTLSHSFVVQSFVQRSSEPVQNGLWCSSWREQSPPRPRPEFRQAAFLGGRDVRKRLATLSGCTCIGPETSALDVRTEIGD
jgi:hypothetical protein